MGTVIVASVLAVWFGLSAACQLTVPWGERPLDRLRARDVFGLIPNFKFFAPQPVQHDFHLLMRTVVDGAHGPWSQVAGPPERCWWHAVWNPDRRAFKILSDVMAVAYRFDEDKPRAVQTSLPYLAILNYITEAASQDPSASHVQFVLAISHGVLSTEEPSVVYKSDLHSLGERDDSSERNSHHRDRGRNRGRHLFA